jgi:hypothetical protein
VVPSWKKRKKRRQGWWWSFGIEVYMRDGWLFAWRNGWTGQPTDCRMAQMGGLVGRPLLALIERMAEEMLAKKANRVSKDGEVAQLVDEEFKTNYPVLFDHLTQTKWPDGSARQTSSLLIFTIDGQVRAMLRDKEASECLWVTLPSLWLVFDALEAKLNDAEADWRTDRQQEGQTAKRVKKGVDAGRG